MKVASPWIRFVFLAAVPVFSTSTQAHRCTLADGTMRVGLSSCLGLGAVRDELEPGDATEKSDFQRQREASEARTRGREALRKRYETYCEEIGYESVESMLQCSQEEIRNYDWLLQQQKSMQAGSPQRDRLSRCVRLHHNEATDLYDATKIRRCYFLP